jgi:hypothetical protein
MPVQRWDVTVPPERGAGYEERYWIPVNAPVLDDQGHVIAFVHRVETSPNRCG